MQVRIHLSNRRENTYLRSLGETLSTGRDRWRKACCTAVQQCQRWHPHTALTPPRILLVKHRKLWAVKAMFFTVLSKFFPWMQPSKSKPGARNSNCIAFWDVLGILLLLLSRVPRVADLHDCAVFSKMLWKETLGGRQKTWSVWVSPWPWLLGIKTESAVWHQFFSFLRSTFKILLFLNCHTNTHIKRSIGRLLS